MSDRKVHNQILEMLRQRGSLMLREMYVASPYDSSGGDCELDRPLGELEAEGSVFSRGQRRTPHGAQNIVWHLATTQE